MIPENSQSEFTLNKIVLKNIRKPANRSLTSRELEVIQLLKKGYFYREVSMELEITIDTVKKHLKNIYTKMEVRNKTEALNKLFYKQN